MRLGLGLSLGSSSYGPTFSMADIAWTGWWDGDHYDPVTGIAVGQASAGASGGRNTTAPGTKPTAGATYNGHASFNTGAIGKYLSTGLALSSFVANNAWFAVFVSNIAASGGDGPGYTRGSALAETGSYWAIGGGSTTNVDFYQTPASGGETNLKLSDGSGGGDGWLAGSLQVFTAWGDGVNFYARVNNNPVDQATSALIHATALAGTLLIGSSYNGAVAYQADTTEVAITNTIPSEDNRDAVVAAMLAKYGL